MLGQVFPDAADEEAKILPSKKNSDPCTGAARCPGVTNPGETHEKPSPMVHGRTYAVGQRDGLSSIPRAGRGRWQGHPEVPGLVLRAVMGGESSKTGPAEASTGTTGPAVAARRPADARHVHQQGRRSGCKQNV